MSGGAIVAIVFALLLIAVAYSLFTRSGSGIDPRPDKGETREEAESDEVSGAPSDDDPDFQHGTK